MLSTRMTARLAAGTALAGGVLAASALPASAHVTASPSSTRAGSYTVVTMAFGHGCGTSPTTSLEIQIPEGIYSVAPQVHPGWTIDKVMEDLDTPVDDGHGGEFTQRVAQVTYTADEPVADGYRFSTDLSLKLPSEVAPGTRLEFPTVQVCTEGETAWVEPTPESGEEPDYPAPSFVITDAEADDHGDKSVNAAEDTPQAQDEEDTNVLGWVSLAAALLGLGLGGAALARTRRA